MSDMDESNQGLTLAAIIAVSGAILVAAFATLLFAVRLLAALETRLSELKAVAEGVGFP